MDEKILFVDDDEPTLNYYQRELKRYFDVDIAIGAQEGLRILRENGPYAIVVADMRMPQINGIEFLENIQNSSPQTVRFMLTGYPDHDTAVAAVDQGKVFHFLSKPCTTENLIKALHAGMDLYRLHNQINQIKTFLKEFE